MLFVGSLFQRRRLDVLIDAFAHVAVARPDARLEIVGANRTSPAVDFAAAIEARGLSSRARLRDWVDDATLDGLYREASVFVFLSRYEGFGFTPLEAMAHGAVPVVLDTAGRPRDLCARPPGASPRGRRSPMMWPARLARCSTTTRCARAYRAAAAPVLASYRWDDAARRVLACLEEAAGA